QFWFPITSVVDELKVFTARHWAVGQLEILHIHGVTWKLVVKRKSISRMAAVNEATVELTPTRWRFRRYFGGKRRPVERFERVTRQHVLDVSQHKLLVLLLVVETEEDGELNFGQRAFTLLRKVLCHRAIDVVPIFKYFFHGRPGKETSLCLRMSLADGVVVGVEQVFEAFMKRPIGSHRGLQHKTLKEPAGMSKVPFGRADVGDGLHDKVFSLKGSTKPIGSLAHLTVKAKQGGVRPNCGSPRQESTQGMGAYQFLGTPCSPRRSVEPYELPIGACTFEPLSPCALLSAAVLNPARPVWPSKLVDDQGPPGPERARARRRRLVLRGASSR